MEPKNERRLDAYPDRDWRPLAGFVLFILVAAIPMYWDRLPLTSHWPHWISNAISSAVMGIPMVVCLYLAPKPANVPGGSMMLVFGGFAFFFALGVLANWL